MTVEHLKHYVTLVASLLPSPSLLSFNDVFFSQFLCCSSIVSGWKMILFNNCSGYVCVQTVQCFINSRSSVSRVVWIEIDAVGLMFSACKRKF